MNGIRHRGPVDSKESGMTYEELCSHLASGEHLGGSVVVEVASGDETYLRGFHDGLHGRIDSDDIAFSGHDE